VGLLCEEVEELGWVLIRWQKRLSSVSVERLVAGPAIPRIYNFFCDDNPRLANPKITKEIFGKGDPSAAISKHALEATVGRSAKV